MLKSYTRQYTHEIIFLVHNLYQYIEIILLNSVAEQQLNSFNFSCVGKWGPYFQFLIMDFLIFETDA